MNRLLTISFILFCHLGFGQIVAEPFLYSSGGGSYTHGSMNIDFSVGEPVITTVSAQGVTLTQGFHQPETTSIFDNTFTVNYSSKNTCVGEENGEILLSISGGIPPYLIVWQDVPGDSTLDERDGLGIGTFSVTITDQDDNEKTLEIEITETDDCLEIYTGITPNGDGYNDYWHIGNIEFYNSSKVQLFSRWGNMVWETTGYDNTFNRWEGLDLSGQRLPDGTYFYIIQNAGPNTYKGWVELTGELR